MWDGDSQAYASSAVDLLSLAHEVSERIKSETELHATRERHRAFIQASLDSIWAVDVEPAIPTSLPPQEQIALLRERGLISDVNAAFARDYHRDETDVIGRRLSEFMPELFKGTSLRDWIDRGYRLNERELRLKVRGEDLHWLTLTLLGVVEDGKLVRLWGARRNVTDRKRYQSLLEHLAFRDPLTGLLNRQRLVAEINENIEQSGHLGDDPSAALLLLDLNQFKDINDTLGHSAGDEVLRQMKDRFDEALTNEDAIAARLGGDEFGVFVRGVGTAEGAMRVAEAIAQGVRDAAHRVRQGLHFSHTYLTLEAAGSGEGVALASDVLAADARLHKRFPQITKTVDPKTLQDSADVFSAKDIAPSTNPGELSFSQAWLANKLGEHGKRLKKGMIVSTGSMVACQFVPPGSTATGRIEGLGEVTLKYELPK